MTIKILKGFIVFSMLLLFIALSNECNATAAVNSTVSYSISKTSPQVGESFDITINGQNITDLYGGSVDFKYDSALIQVTGIDMGTALSGNNVLKGTPIIDSQQGKISFYMTLQGNIPGINVSSESLYIIHAKALKTGSMDLNAVYDNSPLTNTGNNLCVRLVNSNIQEISYIANKATVNVTQILGNRSEENAAGVSLNGYWGISTNTSNSGGRAIYSNTAGSFAQFSFSGTAIRWYGLSDVNKGIAKVFIDGILQQTIDTYSSTTQFSKLLFEKTNLLAGSHTIKIEVTNTKNTSAAASFISVDSFEVINTSNNTIFQENSNGVSLNGSWGVSTNASNNGGRAIYSNTAGGYAQLPFSGTGVRWYGLSDMNKGIAKVYIDGVMLQTVDTYSSITQFNKLLFQKTNLSSGNHTIKIEVTNTKNPSAAASFISVDSFEVLN